MPHNCKVTLVGGMEGKGWSMKEPDPYMAKALKTAGADFFNGNETKTYGVGGSIPFLAELNKMYPKSFVIALGLVGQDTNVHAPNEAMNLDFAQKLTCSLSHIIAAIGA